MMPKFNRVEIIDTENESFIRINDMVLAHVAGYKVEREAVGIGRVTFSILCEEISVTHKHKEPI